MNEFAVAVPVGLSAYPSLARRSQLMDASRLLWRLQELEKTTQQLSEENVALQRCLEEAGVLRPLDLAVELHRSRFDRVRRLCPLGATPSAADAVVPEAFVTIASYAGSSAARSLAISGPSLWTSSEEAASLLPPRQRIYAIGGFNHKCGGRLRVVERYDPDRDLWSPVSALRDARDGLGAVVLGTRVYVVGGSNSHYEAVDTVERYDPARGAWESAAPLATARRALAVVELDKKAYALGGHDDQETVGLAERYDPETRTWRAVANMPTARWYLAAVAYDGQIYAVGGADEDLSPLNAVECYHPGEDRWYPRSPMPTARGALTMVVLGDRLYALGGGALEGPLAITERYDPEADSWESAASMSLARCGIAATVADGQIYVMGGNGDGFISVADDSKLDLVERYDSRRDVWEQVASMPTARSHLAVVTLHTGV